jgi:hypothetical protein
VVLAISLIGLLVFWLLEVLQSVEEVLAIFRELHDDFLESFALFAPLSGSSGGVLVPGVPSAFVLSFCKFVFELFDFLLVL